MACKLVGMTSPTFTTASAVAPLETLLNSLSGAANTDTGTVSGRVTTLEGGSGRGTGADIITSTLTTLNSAAVTASAGDTFMVSTASTGIVRHLWLKVVGAAPYAVPLGTIYAGTKANMDAYVTLVNAQTNIGSQPGGQWYDISTKRFYTFIDASFGYKFTGTAETVKTTTVAGSGVVYDSSTGVITCTAATVAALDQMFEAGYDYDLEVEGSMSVAGTITGNFRTSVPADDVSANYDSNNLVGTTLTTSSAQALASTSWPIGAGTSVLHIVKLFITNPNSASAAKGISYSGGISNPMVNSTGNSTVVKTFLFRNSTAFAGLKLTFSSAFTGTIRPVKKTR